MAVLAATDVRAGAPEASDVPAEIQQLERDLARAVVAVDVDTIRRIEAPTYVYTGSDGRVGRREDFIQGHQTARPVRSLSFDDMIVEVYGDAAVVRGVQTVERVADGVPIRSVSRYTRFYVRFPQGWQAVAAHASPIASAAEKRAP